MEFTTKHSIYEQIADIFCERVLLKKFKEGKRIPSVRDFALELSVNPNTVMRSYDLLESLSIIENKRGIGFFLSMGGYEKVIAYRKSIFLEKELPVLLSTAALLKIRTEELQELYIDQLKKFGQ
jgi:DNA-binding transcriptional regulator YhcF (GntR family)